MPRYSWMYVTWLVLFFSVTNPVSAQELTELRNWQAYAYFGVGARPSDGQGALDIGAGAQWFLGGTGFALGAEGHSFGFTGCWSCGAFIISATAAYEWRGDRERRKLSPFVGVGGGSALTEGGGVGIFSTFAGANYWLSDRVAVRFGAHGDFTAEGDSYVYFRGGITF